MDLSNCALLFPRDAYISVQQVSLRTDPLLWKLESTSVRRLQHGFGVFPHVDPMRALAKTVVADEEVKFLFSLHAVERCTSKVSERTGDYSRPRLIRRVSGVNRFQFFVAADAV